MTFDEIRHDAEFAADEFSRDDLIEHLISLYKTIEALDASVARSKGIRATDEEE